MPRIALAVSLSALSLAAQGWVDRTPTNPSASPGPRRNAAMCWDAAHNYVLMFGGEAAQYGVQDTWSWNGTAWTQYSSAVLPNIAPAPGYEFEAMVFHPPTNEVVLFAGNATWTWSGSNWIARPSATLPTSTYGSPCFVAMGRDTARGETVFFVSGRFSNQASPTAETYLWDGFAWSPRATSTRPGPSGRVSMAFDPVAGRLLMQITGQGGGISTYWEWTGTNWQQRFYTGAPAAGGAMACDTANTTVVMLDGVLDALPNHSWTLANGSIQRRSTPVEPARRTDAAMAFDPIRGKTLLFGGFNGLELGDTWEFTPGASATYTTFGAGCTGTRGIPTLAAQQGSLPRIGQTLSLQIGNAPVQGQIFLFLGFSNTDWTGTPLPFSLAPFGANGCNVLVSGDQTFLLPNLLGTSVWNASVPNLPGVQFYNQAFVFDAAANPFGVTASNAGQGVVGL